MANRPRRRVPRLRQACAAAALLLAGSCSTPELVPPPPPSAPPRRPAAPPPLPPAQSWQDMPITPGDWRWSSESGRSTARFGRPGDTVFALACRGDGSVVLTRRGALHAPAPTAAVTVILRAGTASRPLAGQAGADGVAVALDARDPLLDAIAFARGRFAVEVQGMAVLALPSWPEVARVIDDCRSAPVANPVGG
ncbi:MAG: hypothetical protein KGM17_15730 [Sphingomonadales bacterium]|nr:hypothetical protein [Sphingomonadales bacterium]